MEASGVEQFGVFLEAGDWGIVLDGLLVARSATAEAGEIEGSTPEQREKVVSDLVKHISSQLPRRALMEIAEIVR